MSLSEAEEARRAKEAAERERLPAPKETPEERAEREHEQKLRREAERERDNP